MSTTLSLLHKFQKNLHLLFWISNFQFHPKKKNKSKNINGISAILWKSQIGNPEIQMRNERKVEQNDDALINWVPYIEIDDECPLYTYLDRETTA